MRLATPAICFSLDDIPTLAAKMQPMDAPIGRFNWQWWGAKSNGKPVARNEMETGSRWAYNGNAGLVVETLQVGTAGAKRLTERPYIGRSITDDTIDRNLPLFADRAKPAKPLGWFRYEIKDGKSFIHHDYALVEVVPGKVIAYPAELVWLAINRAKADRVLVNGHGQVLFAVGQTFVAIATPYRYDKIIPAEWHAKGEPRQGGFGCHVRREMPDEWYTTEEEK